MIHIYRSNRTDALSARLAKILDSERGDPMVQEVIAIQGRGMERWLSAQLGQSLGSAANIRFPFPRTIVGEVLEAVLGDEGKAADRWTPQRLVWDVLDVLPELLLDADFADLKRYLDTDRKLDEHLKNGKLGESLDARALELTERIVATIDRYFTYRPDMIIGWLDGKTPDREALWQAKLVRKLRDKIGVPTLPELLRDATRKLETAPSLPTLWKRLIIFGVPTFPPAYLRLLATLPDAHAVHLFVFAPTQEHLAPFVQRATRNSHDEHDTADDADIKPTHPLLASLGRVSGEFQDVIEREVPNVASDETLFVDPGRDTLLHAVQQDLLQMRLPSDEERLALNDAELHPESHSRSIELHSSHGKMRQVEVLRDVLLRAFNESPDLQPRDVLVVTPNVEEYAPLIDAVFSDGFPDKRPKGEDGFKTPSIPFRVADRPQAYENPVAETLIELLQFVTARITAVELTGLLRREPVRRKWGLDEQQVDSMLRWASQSGFRWGLDGAHRASHGLPNESHFTAQGALDRMVLGHAMRGDDKRLFADLLPYDCADDADVLEAFSAGFEAIRDRLEDLGKPQTLATFAENIGKAMDELCSVSAKNSWQIQAVHQMLGDLLEASGESTLLLQPRALASLFEAPLKAASSKNFASGAVTVCALVPMRSVGFRMVCMLGVDEAEFPRAHIPLGFDLTARRPELGDRRGDDDDRQLFLEALISAQDRFVVIYSGHQRSDNKRLAPAIPVAELLESIAQYADLPAELSATKRREEVEKHLLRDHPLQAFSGRAFKSGDAIQSFDYRRLDAAERLRGEAKKPRPFASGRIATARQEQGVGPTISIDDLGRFFKDPGRGFFTQGLKALVDDREESVPFEDPLKLGSLERWALGDAVLKLVRGGVPADQIRKIIRAQGHVSSNAAGDADLNAAILRFCTGDWKKWLDRLAAGTARPPLEIQKEVAGVEIRGQVRDLYELTGITDVGPRTRVVVTSSSESPEREVEQWVHHLVMCSETPDEPTTTLFIESVKGEPSPLLFAHVPDAERHLKELVATWKEGLAAPLPFHPRPAAKYRDALQAEGTPIESAVAVAWKEWKPNAGPDAPPGPGEKPYTERLYGHLGDELFTDHVDLPSELRFPALVELILGPLKAHSSTPSPTESQTETEEAPHVASA